MAYTLTQNSRQAPLNQKQQRLFVTEGISDIIVRQNFEILNKELNRRLTKELQPKANIAFSPAFGTGSTLTDLLVFNTAPITVTPGALQVQIKTSGNPVRLKLAPFSATGLRTGTSSTFQITGQLATTSNSSAIVECGWSRDNTPIAFIKAGAFMTVGSSSDANIKSSPLAILALPAFEFDDVVPAGTYTYQFFISATDTNVYVKARNIQVVAYELG